jgi:hypothetical protein
MDTTMNAKPQLQAVSTFETEARAKLAAHLDRIDDAASVASDFDSQFKRLRTIVEAEKQALARLEQVRADQAQDLADAVREGKMIPGNNTDDLSDAEHAVRVAQRDADAARRVLPGIEPQLNAARAEVNRLNALTPPLVAQVLVDESSRIAKEMMADTERLRKKAATVWGLRMLMNTFQQPQMRGFFAALGEVHAEWPVPTNNAASDEADRWSSLYSALLQDQTMKIEEIGE